MKMKKLFASAMALALTVCCALSLTGCSAKINSIGLPTDEILEKGDTLALEISYGTENEATEEKLAEAVSKLTLVWTSSDEAVATVDESGLVTAVGPGEADVSVSIQDANLSSVCHITVIVTATDFDVPDTLELSTNGEATRELGAKPNPEDATNVNFSYSSSSDEVATVDENGIVTAVANGECDITVRMEQKNPVKGTVSEDAESVGESEAQDTDAQEVAPVEEFASDVNVEPAEDTPSEEEPSSEEQSTEETPVVTDLELPGTNGTTEGVVIEKTVHVVVTTAVEDITLNNNEGILTVGNTYTIKATVTPENATDKTVTWASSDEKVATVDANGKVTAKAVGTAVITAKAGDKSAEYKLTVQQVKCSYCGKTGHTSANCPQKAADQRAAQAAAQAAAAAAAQQQAAAAAPSGGGSSDTGSSGGATGGGESAPAPSNPAPETPVDKPITATGADGWDWNTIIEGTPDKSCPPEDVGFLC